MSSPYATIQDLSGELEHAFVKKYGSRTGFKLKRYIRVNGIFDGQRRHIGWYPWSGLKRDLVALLRGLSHDVHDEDLNYFLCIARNDVTRDAAFEADITPHVIEINLGG